MTSPLENLTGPGKPLKAEPPDAKEFAAHRWYMSADFCPHPTPSSATPCAACGPSTRAFIFSMRFCLATGKPGIAVLRRPTFPKP